MKLNLTNTDQSPVPIYSRDGVGWVETLQPNKRFELDLPDNDTVMIGEQPGLDDVGEVAGKKTKLSLIKELLARWRGREEDKGDKANPIIFVSIENDGEKTVRVIMGDPANESTLAPGDYMDAEAADYIEIREVGAGKGKR